MRYALEHGYGAGQVTAPLRMHSSQPLPLSGQLPPAQFQSACPVANPSVPSNGCFGHRVAVLVVSSNGCAAVSRMCCLSPLSIYSGGGAALQEWGQYEAQHRQAMADAAAIAVALQQAEQFMSHQISQVREGFRGSGRSVLGCVLLSRVRCGKPVVLLRTWLESSWLGKQWVITCAAGRLRLQRLGGVD